MTITIKVKIDELERRFQDLESAVIAFSGGVDSSVLLACAHKVLGEKAIAVTALSPSFSAREMDHAVQFCAQRGISHIIVETNELDDPRYAANPEDRCYHCKRILLAHLLEIANERGARFVVEGTNASELEGHRPGRWATLEENRVVTPLVDTNFTKEDVREAARALGLETWDMPSAACLASRIPRGTAITKDLLSRIGAAEQVIRDLGVKQVRVRHHGDIARIEVDDHELALVIERRNDVVANLKTLGWRFIALDIEGYRTGSLSEWERAQDGSGDDQKDPA